MVKAYRPVSFPWFQACRPWEEMNQQAIIIDPVFLQLPMWHNISLLHSLMSDRRPPTHGSAVWRSCGFPASGGSTTVLGYHHSRAHLRMTALTGGASSRASNTSLLPSFVQLPPFSQMGRLGVVTTTNTCGSRLRRLRPTSQKEGSIVLWVCDGLIEEEKRLWSRPLARCTTYYWWLERVGATNLPPFDTCRVLLLMESLPPPFLCSPEISSSQPSWPDDKCSAKGSKIRCYGACE